MSKKWRRRMIAVKWLLIGAFVGPIAGEWWHDEEVRKGLVE